MPNTIGWYIPGHVIYWRIYGEGNTLETACAASEQVAHMLSQNKYQYVHILLDAQFTPGFKLVKLAAALVHLGHPRLGWTMRCVHDPDLKMWGAVISTKTQTRYRNVKSLHDGWEFLKSMDPKLPQEPFDSKRIANLHPPAIN